jgi:hypothetical protein
MENRKIAHDLLKPLWQGIPAEYKSRYSYSIWRQFEDNIRSAAYTSRLSLFLSRITERLGIQIADRYADAVRSVIESGEDRDVLRALREDTTLLVLMVRVENEERLEKKRKRKAAVNLEKFLKGGDSDEDDPLGGDSHGTVLDRA